MINEWRRGVPGTSWCNTPGVTRPEQEFSAFVIDLYSQQNEMGNHCHDRLFHMPRERGNGYFRSVCPRRGMLLFMEDYQLHRDMVIDTDNMQLPIGFSYCISGRVRWTIEGVSKRFDTETGQCELLFTRRTNGSAEYDARTPVTMINVMICPELFRDFFDDPLNGFSGGGADGGPLSRLLSVQEDLFYRKNVLPPGIVATLKQLLRAPCRCLADALYMQGKVLELVAFQLKLLDKPAPRPQPKYPADPDTIRRATRILCRNLQKPPTLNRLARMVGVNETKLKLGFRAHCNTTVYGYLTARRMERACELLEDTGLSLSHIAHELGFSERTHFTRAFSKFYGYPPSQYRNSRFPVAV